MANGVEVDLRIKTFDVQLDFLAAFFAFKRLNQYFSAGNVTDRNASFSGNRKVDSDAGGFIGRIGNVLFHIQLLSPYIRINTHRQRIANPDF